MSLLVLLQIDTFQTSMQVANAGKEEMTYFDLLLKGGLILIPIFLLSIWTVYLFFDRLFYIRRAVRINETVMGQYKIYLKDLSSDKALTLLSAEQGSLSRIMYQAVNLIGRPVKDIESAIELTSQVEINRMNRGLNYLGLIAGIAPMLGFIGTILGVIKIFYSISLTDNISIGIISGGLYQKMISSATGLTVGVVAFMGYHILKALISKFMDRVEEESLEFFNIINSKV